MIYFITAPSQIIFKREKILHPIRHHHPCNRISERNIPSDTGVSSISEAHSHSLEENNTLFSLLFLRLVEK
jgi:hypothetical protein